MNTTKEKKNIAIELERIIQIPAEKTDARTPGFCLPRHPYLCPPEEFSYDEFLRRVTDALTHDRDGFPVETYRASDVMELVDRYVSDRMFEDYVPEEGELNSEPTLKCVVEILSPELRRQEMGDRDDVRLRLILQKVAYSDCLTTASLEDLWRNLYQKHYTVFNLKQTCRELGLPVTGKKAELVERILEASAQENKRDRVRIKKENDAWIEKEMNDGQSK